MIGNIVFSKCGHDKGKTFIVINQFNDYCYLVDGKYRLLDRPKKKKIKHVQFTNYSCLSIISLLQNNSCSNLDIRNAIKKFEERD